MQASKGRQNKLAQQIGEHLVCAQLGRQGLLATPFAGNVPVFDVIAANEACETVPIQVKTTRGDSWRTDARTWMDVELDAASGVQHYRGPRTLPNPDLIYVHVALAPAEPDRPVTPDRFFVLTATDVQRVCVESYSRWMETVGWRRPRKQDSFDCRYSISQIASFENQWELIKSRLSAK